MHMNRIAVVGALVVLVGAATGYAALSHTAPQTSSVTTDYYLHGYTPESAGQAAELVAVAEVVEVGEARFNTPDGKAPPRFTAAALGATWIIYRPVTLRPLKMLKGAATSIMRTM